MPSAEHEAILLLLREQPAVLVRLLDAVGIHLPDHREIQIREADFTQLVPTEYRADLVVTLERDGPVAALVIEPQHSRDDDKRFSWPLYLAALHARVRCPTWLVVVAGSDALARWASRPIETFHPGSQFVPVVVGPRDIPRITSVADANELPELAVMSARAHGNDPDGAGVVTTAIAALVELGDRAPERAKLYFDLVLSALNAGARAILETEMESRGYEYQSEFARRYLEQGREEGRKEGREEGRVAGLRAACEALIEAKLGTLSPVDAARLEAVTDSGSLEALLLDLASASDEAAARKALDRLG
jgi:hypothetical protein